MQYKEEKKLNNLATIQENWISIHIVIHIIIIKPRVNNNPKENYAIIICFNKELEQTFVSF